MPNRIIQESARISRTLAALTPWGERLLWRMTTVADDFGRFNSEPAIVHATCFPLFPGLTEQIDALLGELASVGLIAIYSHGERRQRVLERTLSRIEPAISLIRDALSKV